MPSGPNVCESLVSYDFLLSIFHVAPCFREERKSVHAVNDTSRRRASSVREDDEAVCVTNVDTYAAHEGGGQLDFTALM